MAATAAMAAELRRMVDESTETTYDDDLILAIIAKYPLIDALGTDPLEYDYTTEPPTASEVDNWIPTYDLHAAASQIWDEKAGAVSDEFDFSADGGKYTRSQKIEMCMGQSRWHASRKSPKAFKIWVSPRLDIEEENNA